MDFRKKMKQRLWIAISYIALGLILVIADAVNHFENYFFSSFGFALVIMGILRIIRHRKTMRNDQSIRKQELSEIDERIRMISERAKSWAFSFSLLVCGIVVIVLSLMGYHDQAQPFTWYICGMVVLYWIFWFILGKKY